MNAELSIGVIASLFLEYHATRNSNLYLIERHWQKYTLGSRHLGG